MSAPKKLISIVLPSYREEENISYIYGELLPILQNLENYEYEITFVNDGSPDRTWEEIEKICAQDARVKGVNLSRNFGKELAITAGLEHSHGDAVITLDADGQHPVEKIPEFIREWESGYDIVYNRRPQTRNATWIKKKSSDWFYAIFNKISEFKLESGTTDYRLLDRPVVEAYLRFSEKNRMYRGLVDWLGFSKKVLIFDAKDRAHGQATYSAKMLIRLAIHSLTSFSFFPLKLVGWLGFFMTIVSSGLLMFVLIDKFTIDKFAFSNIAAMLLANTALIGIVLMSLGLIGLYIANIHEEVIGRPLYVVKDKRNFQEKKK